MIRTPHLDDQLRAASERMVESQPAWSTSSFRARSMDCIDFLLDANFLNKMQADYAFRSLNYAIDMTHDCPND